MAFTIAIGIVGKITIVTTIHETDCPHNKSCLVLSQCKPTAVWRGFYLFVCNNVSLCSIWLQAPQLLSGTAAKSINIQVTP